MKQSREFSHQDLGFFFSLNSARTSEEAALTLSQWDAIWQIIKRAHQLLAASLPALPQWNKVDEQDGFSYSPYELYEAEVGPEKEGEFLAFGVWLHSYHRFDMDTVRAFQVEVTKCFEETTRELGGECQYLYAKSAITEQVTTTPMLSDEEMCPAPASPESSVTPAT